MITLKVGLTGGIACGKTTASNMFKELNVPIINADNINHNILAQPNITKKIINHFGKNYSKQSGELNIALLRENILNNAKHRHWLEQLLHPLIIAEISIQVAKINHNYCIIEIPLLIESDSINLVDRILVVDCSSEIQIQRAKKRCDMPLSQIQQIINLQIPRKKRLVYATDTINNDGNLQHLQKQVKDLHMLFNSATM